MHNGTHSSPIERSIPAGQLRRSSNANSAHNIQNRTVIQVVSGSESPRRHDSQLDMSCTDTSLVLARIVRSVSAMYMYMAPDPRP